MTKVNAEGAETPKLDEEGNPIVEEAKPEDPKPASKDPLDAIEDEVERLEAKKTRAIENRIARKAKEEEDSKPTINPDDFVTKDDQKVIATRNAKNMVAPEINEVWDELTKIPLGGYDPMDAESMAENMKQRYTLYLADNPPTEDATKDLSSSPNVPPSGKGPKPKAKESKPLPGLTEPAQPEDWYPAPE